ncbi:carbohydrate porin [Pleurocapsales cyanobacterium LEGE 06147]|nr:carbohydrate porin [Pleurocapsales cyanobacterium LEGE 06147]
MLTSNSLLCLGKLFLSLAIGLNFVSLFSSVAYASNNTLEFTKLKQISSEGNNFNVSAIIPIQKPTIAASETSYPSVSELKDIAPSDWAYQKLQLLIERYMVITGYPDATFKGNRPLTRYEFAAALNKMLEQVERLIAQEKTSVSSNDLATLQRLRQEFEAELVTLESRVDELESRTNFLEANQFSTTTKLTTRVILAATGGGFDGDRIIDVTGREITADDPNTTLIYRTSFSLNTSFSGTDSLVTWLEIGSDGIDDNAGGFLEPTFGSVLDYSAKPPVEELGISRLYYTFSPSKNFNLTFGSTLSLTDYIDANSYVNPSFLNFSTLALVQNYILFPVQGLGAGAAVDWNPVESIRIKAVYVAASANEPSSDNSSFTPGIFPLGYILYPDGESDRGLFGSPYQGAIELEFTPIETFTIRFQYTGGDILGERFDVLGVNFELAISEEFAVFGRYGYGSYKNTDFGDINPSYWMAGIAFPDLFVSGARIGIAVGQPFIASELGNATQTNIEAFYNFPVNDNIRITPLIQVVTNPANQDSNGTIISVTLRTVFSF